MFPRLYSRKRPVSEAGCPIIVIIRRTRFAQTASHVDLLSLLCNSRIEEDSDNSTSSKDLLVRNAFREYIRGNMEHRAVTSLLASLVEVIGLPLPPLSSRLSDGAVRGKLSLLKLFRVATEFDVVKCSAWRDLLRFLGQTKRQSRALDYARDDIRTAFLLQEYFNVL